MDAGVGFAIAWFVCLLVFILFALATSNDAGTLAWNLFGWRETLAHATRSRYPSHALRLLGTVPAVLARPLDRRERRGTTYTVALRRPIP